MDKLNKVKQFHELFGVVVKDSIDITDEKTNKLRLDLLKEELGELEKALQDKNKVEVLDALADIEYILKGTILSLGYSNVFDQAFDRVHISNMSKACNDETEVSKTLKHYEDNYNTSAYAKYINGKYLIYRREDNKVLKSINYQAVKLDDLCL
jgi:predicted HAD superfamily Cof-like phosphohydrolase